MIGVEAASFVEIMGVDSGRFRIAQAGEVPRHGCGILNLAAGEFEFGRQSGEVHVGVNMTVAVERRRPDA